MGEHDQVMALFDMLRYLRGEIASVKRDILDLHADLTHYRNLREQKEVKEQTTSQKIRAVIKEQFDFWAWFRDKVLPSILTVIVLALLVLAFSK